VAQKIDFGVPITGYLCCAEFQPPCMTGIVFLEARGRFEDGRSIRTSRVVRVFDLEGYQLCETSNRSRYVICHWLRENGAVPMVDIIHWTMAVLPFWSERDL